MYYGRGYLGLVLLGLILLGAGWAALTDGMGKYDRRSRGETNIAGLLSLLAGIAILGYCVYLWLPFRARP